MYVMDGSHCFPIYWTNNPLLVYNFGYETLDALEVQTLAIIDAFQVLKVKELMNIKP